MIKGIIFDLDGVLVDAVDWHYLALNKALSMFGYTISRSEHGLLYNGLPTAVKLELLSQRRGLPRKLHPLINSLKQKFTHQMIASSCMPEIKVSAILRHLKAQGYRLAVASNCIRSSVELFLERLAIREYFNVILSNEDVTHPKPDGEIYCRCIDLLGLTPRETLVIEDSLPGIQAARVSGANLLIVTGTEEVTLDRILKQVYEVNANHRSDRSGVPGQHLSPPRQLEVIIPMAGLGQRFAAAGYQQPKPLIEVGGKPMIQRVVENVCPRKREAHFTFICNSQHLIDHDLESLLQTIAPGCSIVKIPSVSEGAACTVLLAIEHLNPLSPLMLVNSDQCIDASIDDFLDCALSVQVDGLIMTFEAGDKKWSFAEVNAEGRVIRVAEKVPISRHATVGIYFYREARQFLDGAMDMIRKDLRTNGEFYVCPVYNEIIAKGHDVRIYEIPAGAMHGLGTPEDLDSFLQAHSYHLSSQKLSPSLKDNDRRHFPS